MIAWARKSVAQPQEPGDKVMQPTQVIAFTGPDITEAQIMTNVATTKHEETTTPEPTLPPSPFTEADVKLLAELITVEAEVVKWDGIKYGVSAYARIAAVGWTALNRMDQTGDTLEKVIKAPYQFAWREGIEAPEDLQILAADILDRYWREKNGEADVGRTLPASYTFFHGDGRENYFREQFEKTGAYWDWSLPDPYAQQ